MEKESGTLSIWTIAGGVLLALVIWRAMNVWQYNRAIEEFNATIVNTLQEARRGSEESRVRMASQQRQREESAALQARTSAFQEQRNREASELKVDERCINKQRFRRIANGWEQTGSC